MFWQSLKASTPFVHRSGRNVLKIDGSNGPEELEFLSENDTGPSALFSGEVSSSSQGNEAVVDMKAAAIGVDNGMEVDLTGSAHATSSSAASSSTVGTLSNEAKLEQLQALGFSKSESEQALSQADGEVDLAATLLFSSR